MDSTSPRRAKKQKPTFIVRKIKSPIRIHIAANAPASRSVLHRPTLPAWKKFAPAFVMAALVISLVGGNVVNADSPHTATIAITSLTDDTATHFPPFSFSCPSNPLFNPVFVAGSGTLTSPTGLITQYHYLVNWGDGTSTIGSIFTGSDPNYAFSFNFGPHTYSTTSNFTISAKVYHSQQSGADTTDATTTPITVCVHVPPPTKGSLTVTKMVVNDDGGTKQVSDFPLSVGTQSVTSGIVQDFLAGSYTVAESNANGYTATFSGDCDNAGQVTIVAGQNYSCTLTNNDNPVVPPTTGTLNVIKHVVNNNGGTKVAGDFAVSVAGSGATPSSFPGSESGTSVTLNPGSYSVGESGSSGYSSSLSSDCTGSIVAGQTKTCTVTNDDQAATLTVIKQVVNDNGGTKTSADFTMNVSGSNVSSSSFAGADTPGTTITLDAGGYNVTEIGPAGYNASLSTNCSGTIAIGEGTTCTITNDDIQPKLTVVKVVDNGTNPTPLQVVDFPLFVDGNSVVSGVQNGFNAATVVISETSQTDYVGAFSDDCDANGNVILGLGDVKTCTLTNTYQAPPPPPKATLTVIKYVVNDNGGTATSSNFTMNVSGTNVSTPNGFPGDENGTAVTMDAGSYSVTETGPAGYASSTIGCSGTVASDDSVTCTITNDDIAPQLTVTKVVVNNSGTGTSTVSDFTLQVATTTVVSGVQNTFSAGTYAVTESGGSGGYTATFSGDCDAQGNVTLAVADVKACTITNDDNAPTDADIAVTKSVSDATPDAGGTIVYTLVVTNNGLAAATNVVATDTLPSNLTFVSASSSVGTYNASSSIWTIGSLAKGDSATLGITAAVNSSAAGQTIINTIVASASEPDPDMTNNSASASLTVNIPTPPPSGGGCTSNCGGTTGGGSSGNGSPTGNSGASGGSVLGTSTGTATSLVMPTAVPEVLGESTALPRTGMPVGYIFLVLASVIAVLNKKLKLV